MLHSDIPRLLFTDDLNRILLELAVLSVTIRSNLVPRARKKRQKFQPLSFTAATQTISWWCVVNYYNTKTCSEENGFIPYLLFQFTSPSSSHNSALPI